MTHAGPRESPRHRASVRGSVARPEPVPGDAGPPPAAARLQASRAPTRPPAAPATRAASPPPFARVVLCRESAEAGRTPSEMAVLTQKPRLSIHAVMLRAPRRVRRAVELVAATAETRSRRDYRRAKTYAMTFSIATFVPVPYYAPNSARAARACSPTPASRAFRLHAGAAGRRDGRRSRAPFSPARAPVPADGADAAASSSGTRSTWRPGRRLRPAGGRTFASRARPARGDGGGGGRARARRVGRRGAEAKTQRGDVGGGAAAASPRSRPAERERLRERAGSPGTFGKPGGNPRYEHASTPSAGCGSARGSRGRSPCNSQTVMASRPPPRTAVASDAKPFFRVLVTLGVPTQAATSGGGAGYDAPTCSATTREGTSSAGAQAASATARARGCACARGGGANDPRRERDRRGARSSRVRAGGISSLRGGRFASVDRVLAASAAAATPRRPPRKPAPLPVSIGSAMVVGWAFGARAAPGRSPSRTRADNVALRPDSRWRRTRRPASRKRRSVCSVSRSARA